MNFLAQLCQPLALCCMLAPEQPDDLLLFADQLSQVQQMYAQRLEHSYATRCSAVNKLYKSFLKTELSINILLPWQWRLRSGKVVSGDATLLMLAALVGDTYLMQQIIDRGADVNMRSNVAGITALYAALRHTNEMFNNQKKCVQLLLHHGAECNEVYAWDDPFEPATPLQCLGACCKNDFRWLIDVGASPQIQGPNGQVLMDFLLQPYYEWNTPCYDDILYLLAHGVTYKKVHIPRLFHYALAYKDYTFAQKLIDMHTIFDGQCSCCKKTMIDIALCQVPFSDLFAKIVQRYREHMSLDKFEQYMSIAKILMCRKSKTSVINCLVPVLRAGVRMKNGDLNEAVRYRSQRVVTYLMCCGYVSLNEIHSAKIIGLLSESVLLDQKIRKELKRLGDCLQVFYDYLKKNDFPFCVESAKFLLAYELCRGNAQSLTYVVQKIMNILSSQKEEVLRKIFDPAISVACNLDKMQLMPHLCKELTLRSIHYKPITATLFGNAWRLTQQGINSLMTYLIKSKMYCCKSYRDCMIITQS